MGLASRTSIDLCVRYVKYIIALRWAQPAASYRSRLDRETARAIASGSRLSGGFLYNLVRVARAFPAALREEYADRKARQIPRETGYMRLQITIRPDQVADLMNGQRVTVTRALPTGEEFTAALTRSR